MIKDVNEVKRKLNAGLYNHVGLYNYNDKVIVATNSKADQYTKRVNEVLNTLTNPELNDGVYKIKCKVKYQGGTCDEFLYNKGNNEKPEPMATNPHANLNLPPDFAQAMEHPAIKLQTEITKLQLENDDLARQIEELNDYIADLEEKLSNPPTLSEEQKEPSLMENAKSFLTEIAAMAAPLIDKHYQLREQQQEIERQKLGLQMQPQQKAVEQPNPTAKLENKVKMWIESKSNEPEVYNSICAIYFNSPDVQRFAELLNEFNSNLYEECKQAVR